MVKFRVRGSKIEQRSVISETDKFVWLKDSLFNRERREAKRSVYQNWFDTWVEAHEFLIEIAEMKVISASEDFDDAKSDLESIMAMERT